MRSYVLVMVLALICGYLLGTFPTADLVARAATRGRTGGPVDLRSTGSGNPGATNAAQVLGTRFGVAVLVVDIVKAVVACLVGWAISGGDAALWAGTAAVVGHCLPLWNGFRGGKGVACSAGQCAATFPVYFVIDLAVAYGTAKWKRQAFATTAVASVLWIGAALVWWLGDLPNGWGPRPTAALPASAAATSSMIVAKFLWAQRTTKQKSLRQPMAAS